MIPRLTVVSGTRAGETRPLTGDGIVLGRDPRCDLSFDPRDDIDVSARHAEVRLEGGSAILRDANSTNGTYVNGERLRAERTLRHGDEIRLGARGPRLRYETRESERPPIAGTAERVAVAVERQTRGLRTAFVITGLLLAATLAAVLWQSRESGRARAAELAAERRRGDSISTARDAEVVRMRGRIDGLDSALAAARRVAAAGGTAVDYAAIAAANGPAVAMVAVEMPNGRSYSGTGFGVATNGTLVTNGHLLHGDDGAAPSRIAVIYAGTADWLPARVLRVAGDADLALLRVEATGRFPVVAGWSATPATVGAPVAIVGYPLGTGTAMDGADSTFTARATLGTGTISKTLDRLLQIDAFAAEGSSGSPVFGADGHVVGVVYGGPRGAAGRIVYAVPASVVQQLLRAN